MHIDTFLLGAILGYLFGGDLGRLIFWMRKSAQAQRELDAAIRRYEERIIEHE